MLTNGGYPYEDMDNWEKFNETSLPDKKAFYSSSNINEVIREVIADLFLQKDFTHKKNTKSTKCK